MILDIKTDAGPMKISAKMLKENMDITAPIVTRFFNSILQTGSFPKSWLRSYMVPIPKKGKHSDVKNYRGIAIQSILPKLSIINGKIASSYIEYYTRSTTWFCQIKEHDNKPV